jgi:uncharacterized membrane protein
MNIFAWVRITATFLCSLKAGFPFAFAVVVMPGIRNLGDREFLHSFKVIDRAIQGSQPLFMIIRLGSTFALVVAAALASMHQSVSNRTIIVSAALADVLLVQLPTVAINVPLNQKVQAPDFDTLDGDAASQARKVFDSQWNRCNMIRTLVSCVIPAALLLLLRLL